MPEQQTNQHTPAARKPWNKHLVRAHLWSGATAGLLITGPTSCSEIAVIPPAFICILLFAWTFRLWRDLWRGPVPTLLLLITIWLGIGMAWSPNRALGLEEFGNIRFFAIVLFLVPAIRLSPSGRTWLIASLAAGFIIGNIVQGLHAWALYGEGPDWFAYQRSPGRLSGWWDPAVAGTILTAALGLHLPSALMGSGRTRWIGLVCAAATIIGLLATGSRGGWVASGMLTTLVALIAGVRAFRNHQGRLSLMIALAMLVAVLGIAGFAFRDTITGRVDLARQQISAAAEGRFEGTDGLRLAMKHAAVKAFLDHPIAGVGTGGFSTWADEHRNDKLEIHDHAHDTLLHVAASNGLIGVVLFIALAGVATVQGFKWARTTGLGSYAAGPVFALIGLILATPFDTLHVSGSSAAITGFVLALCAHPPGPPPEDAEPSAKPPPGFAATTTSRRSPDGDKVIRDRQP